MNVAATALAWTVLHSLWQGALMASIAVLTRSFIRSPAARHWLAWMGLVLMVPISLATWGFEVKLASLAADAGGEVRPLAMSTPTILRAALSPLLPYVLVAWGVGSTWAHARMLYGWWQMHAYLSALVPASAWERRAHELARRFSSNMRFRVCVSDHIDSPAVMGALRPFVLLPLRFVANTRPEFVEAVLLHELAHLHRHDYVLNLIQRAVEATFFFHPGLRWLGRCAREDRELACDELALSVGCDRFHFADALLVLERQRMPSDLQLSPGLSAQGGHLMQRIQRIIEHDRRPSRYIPPWLPLGGVSVCIFAALAAPSCLEPAADEPSSPSDPTEAHEREQTEAQAALSPPEPSSTWEPAELDGRWRELFVEAGERHGVDPDLLAVVAWVESRGEPHALSSVGARGLMQIMPATAEKIASKRGLAEHHADRLDDPHYNLDLAAWLLARHLESFGGDVELAAAAYNGGPERVRAWQETGEELSRETHRYKQRVRQLWEDRPYD
ncbi:MAG: hypothetical protein B7733_15780 [Myxococcales bacterium FL481]|nr:MAG: hypothetical protein B7733_15780 [Myxococcales bacterium FL481]